MYDDADSINLEDPSGYFADTLLGSADEAEEAAGAAAQAQGILGYVQSQVLTWEVGFNAAASGWINVASNPQLNSYAAFTVGAIAGAVQALVANSAGATAGAAIGQTLTEIGDLALAGKAPTARDPGAAAGNIALATVGAAVFSQWRGSVVVHPVEDWLIAFDVNLAIPVAEGLYKYLKAVSH